MTKSITKCFQSLRIVLIIVVPRWALMKKYTCKLDAISRHYRISIAHPQNLERVDSISPPDKYERESFLESGTDHGFAGISSINSGCLAEAKAAIHSVTQAASFSLCVHKVMDVFSPPEP